MTKKIVGCEDTANGENILALAKCFMMNFDILFSFLAPISLILIGIMLKFSYNGGWSSHKSIGYILLLEV